MGILQRWKQQGQRAKRLRRAEELTLQGDLKGARAEMDAVLQLFPDDMETLRKSAELSAELNEADETARRLKTLIEKNLREAAHLQNALYDPLRGAAFEELYRFAAGALSASGDSAERALAAELYESAGMFSEAHTAYERIHADDEKRSAQAAYGNARLYAVQDNAEAAAEWLQKAAEAELAQGGAPGLTAGVLEAFESDPTFDEARAEPSIQAAHERLTDARIEALEQAAQEKNAGVRTRLALVAALIKQGDMERAVQAAAEAAERYPNDMDILETRAAALLQVEKAEESLAAYGEMLRLRPDHAGALLGTGAAYERLGRPDAAREAYWDALDSSRGDAYRSALAARGFARLGETQGAAEALRQAADALQPEMPVDFFKREMEHSDFDKMSGREAFQEAAQAFQRRLAQIAPSDQTE